MNKYVKTQNILWFSLRLIFLFCRWLKFWARFLSFALYSKLGLISISKRRHQTWRQTPNRKSRNLAPLQNLRPPTSSKNRLQSSVSFSIESVNWLEEFFVNHHGCNGFTRQKQQGKNFFEKIRKHCRKLSIIEKCMSFLQGESALGPACESRKWFKFVMVLVKIANLHQKNILTPLKRYKI